MLMRTSFSAVDGGRVDTECDESEEDIDEDFAWESKGRRQGGRSLAPTAWLSPSPLMSGEEGTDFLSFSLLRVRTWSTEEMGLERLSKEAF